MFGWYLVSESEIVRWSMWWYCGESEIWKSFWCVLCAAAESEWCGK